MTMMGLGGKMETPVWIDTAPCTGKAQFMWYPPWEAKDPNQWYEMGRLVCATCEVWEECLEYGKDERWGMWGGLTPKERKKPSKTHGNWIDYRRGCDCGECTIAHVIQMAEEPIDTDLLPNKETIEYDDPSGLLFNIL